MILLGKFGLVKASVDRVQLPWPLSEMNYPGPKLGMKPSKPGPENTVLPSMVSGMDGSIALPHTDAGVIGLLLPLCG
jgi:hypothetical protein